MASALFCSQTENAVTATKPSTKKYYPTCNGRITSCLEFKVLLDTASIRKDVHTDNLLSETQLHLSGPQRRLTFHL